VAIILSVVFELLFMITRCDYVSKFYFNNIFNIFCILKHQQLNIVRLFFFWPLYCLSVFELLLLIIRCDIETFFYISFFSFMCMLCRSLFVLLVIVLSVLRFTDSDYPFGIFKLLFRASK